MSLIAGQFHIIIIVLCVYISLPLCCSLFVYCLRVIAECAVCVSTLCLCWLCIGIYLVFKFSLVIERAHKVVQFAQTMLTQQQRNHGRNGHHDNNTIGDEEPCAICQDPLSVPLTLPNCSHTFCEHCIHQWLSRNRSCPLCRAPVRLLPPSLSLWRDGATSLMLQLFQCVCVYVHSVSSSLTLTLSLSLSHSLIHSHSHTLSFTHLSVVNHLSLSRCTRCFSHGSYLLYLKHC